MADLLDTFTGPNGALAAADSGHLPAVLRGSASRAGERGVPGTTDTLVAYDTKLGSEDGEAQLLIGSGGGQALFFRVVDAGNWWRLSRLFSAYQVQTGTTQVLVGYKTVITGYTPVEYEWVHHYNYGTVTHDFSDLYGLHLVEVWTTSSTTAPSAPGSIDHRHYLSGSYYPGDATSHQHAFVQTFRSGRTRGGDPIYGQEAVYETQPVYETRYAQRVELHRTTAGTPTRVASIALADADAIGILRARFVGDAIAVTALTAGTTTTAPAVLGSANVSSPALKGARRNGWGARPSALQASAGVDEMRVKVLGARRGLGMVV